MRIEIGGVWIDPPGLEITSLPIAYTNIDAQVQIYLGDRVFFDATVCLVELANAFHRWLAAEGRPPEFRFESADDDEPNILGFKIGDDGVWLSSAWQRFPADVPVSAERLEAALSAFVQEAARRCRDNLNVDVEDWIKKPD